MVRKLVSRMAFAAFMLVPLLHGVARQAVAAEAQFVGVLAIAVEPESAKRLGLSSEVRAKLLDLIDKREQEALKLTYEIRDLPPSEIAQRLEPFVAESERQGLTLLSLEQRAKLNQLKIARDGMTSLSDDEVASALELTEAQRGQVAELLKQRIGDLSVGGETQRRITHSLYERKLAGILTDSQRAGWEKLAGFAPGSVAAPPSDKPADIAADTAATLTPAAPAPAPAATPSVADTAAVTPPSTPPAADAPATEKPASEMPATETPATPAPAATQAAPETPAPAPPAAAPSAPETPAPAPPAAAPSAPGTPAPPPPATETPAPAPPAAPPSAPETPAPAPPAPAPPAPGPGQPAPERPPGAPAATDAPPVEAKPVDGAAPPKTPESAQPAASETPAGTIMTPRPSEPVPSDGKMAFSFQYAAWKDVIEWFAGNAGLSIQIDQPPPGTFNYQDSRRYTPEEALDILNSVLLRNGFTLVRRDRMLMLLDLEQPIPPELVQLVDVSDLDGRGEFEIVRCVFHLARMTPQDAEQEIGRLLGPGRTMVVLPKARQVVVTETAGKLRTIRAMLEAAENPDGQARKIVNIRLEHIAADQVMAVARPLLGLPEGQNTNEQINISMDEFGTQLFATGVEDAVARLQEVVDLLNRPQESRSATTAIEQPGLVTYPIRQADPATALAVLQTLMAGLPDVRLALDPSSNKLLAFARPSDHRTIVETLAKLEGEADQLEVISLLRSDPQLVILAANKLFGLTAESTGGPQIDADPTTNRLFVRGTEAQIAQIRQLVEKLEGTSDGTAEGRGNVRVIPLGGTQAEQALQQLEAIWPTVSKSRIRVVSPNGGTRGSMFRERVISPDAPLNAEMPGEDAETKPGETSSEASEAPPAAAPRAESTRHEKAPKPPKDSVTRRRSPSAPIHLVSAPLREEPPAASEGAEQAAESPPEKPAAPEAPPAGPPADIVVTLTPSGLVISSNDTKALDQFESMLALVTQQGTSPGLLKREVGLFYLKHIQADLAAKQLQDILGGGSSSGGGASSSLIGDMASNLLGGGGIFGALMGGGGGGGGAESGPLMAATISIVPDVRLNRLIIQGTASELDEVESILQVIDIEDSIIDIRVTGTPHVIPVVYLSADRVATVIQATYADRIGGQNNNQQQQRQPSPEDFIRALRGGGRGGREEQTRGELPKLTVTVHSESNSLIVKAPEGLYQEVLQLVRLIDQPSGEMTEQIAVVSTTANPQVVQQAIAKVLGQTAGSSNSSTSRPSTSSPTGSTGGPSPEDIQRRLEFFRQLQQQGGGGPQPTPGGGGGFPSRGGFGGGGGGSPFGGGGSPFGGGRGGSSSSGGRGSGGSSGGRGGR